MSTRVRNHRPARDCTADALARVVDYLDDAAPTMTTRRARHAWDEIAAEVAEAEGTSPEAAGRRMGDILQLHGVDELVAHIERARRMRRA